MWPKGKGSGVAGWETNVSARFWDNFFVKTGCERRDGDDGNGNSVVVVGGGKGSKALLNGTPPKNKIQKNQKRIKPIIAGLGGCIAGGAGGETVEEGTNEENEAGGSGAAEDNSNGRCCCCCLLICGTETVWIDGGDGDSWMERGAGGDSWNELVGGVIIGQTHSRHPRRFKKL